MNERVWRVIVVSPEGIASGAHVTYRGVPLAQEVELVPADLAAQMTSVLHNVAVASQAPPAEVKRRAAESIRDVRQVLKGCAADLWRTQEGIQA